MLQGSYNDGSKFNISPIYKSIVKPGYHCLPFVLERATTGYYCVRTGYLLFQNGLRRATNMGLYRILFLIFTGLIYRWVQTGHLSDIQVYCQTGLPLSSYCFRTGYAGLLLS